MGSVPYRLTTPYGFSLRPWCARRLCENTFLQPLGTDTPRYRGPQSHLANRGRRWDDHGSGARARALASRGGNVL